LPIKEVFVFPTMKAVEDAAYPDIVPVEGHDAGGGEGHGNDSL